MKPTATALWILLAYVSAIAFLSAAPQSAEPAFDVASIKPNNTGDGVSYIRFPGITVSVTNQSLRNLIMFAYQIRGFQLSGGPTWMDTSRFDVEAKATPGASMDQKREMLQALLRDRFQLALRRETRELPIYNLVVAKGGLKLHPLKEGACVRADREQPGIAPGKNIQDYCGRSGSGPAMLQAGSATMAEAATLLSTVVGRTVVDKTGVAGQFRFQLNFAPVGPSATQNAEASQNDVDLPSLFTAIQEQLGLRLESSKGPVEMLIVDRAEKPSDN